MTPEEQINLLKETRQADINAMLLALLLIDRKQFEEAQRTLMERLPQDITGRLKGKP